LLPVAGLNILQKKEEGKEVDEGILHLRATPEEGCPLIPREKMSSLYFCLRSIA
jgi:hypothetical protein